MKKLFFIAALIFASMAADAQDMAFNSNVIIGDYRPDYDANMVIKITPEQEKKLIANGYTYNFDGSINLNVAKYVLTPDEPCIEFKRSDNAQLQGQQWNAIGDSVIFTWQVTIYIEKVGAGKFEKVDNFTQVLALGEICDKLCLQAKGNTAADAYIAKNYPDIP